MALKPLRPCRHSGCAELTRDGWCPRHRPSYQRKRSKDYHAWYFLPIWTKRLRPQQLLQEPFCQLCAEKGHCTRATVADHKIPHRGDWRLFSDPSNLQSLCSHCHGQKTQEEMRLFGR